MQDEGNGRVMVHNNKQGFQDCELYADLEEWLGKVTDEYWDTYFDPIKLVNIVFLSARFSRQYMFFCYTQSSLNIGFLI